MLAFTVSPSSFHQYRTIGATTCASSSYNHIRQSPLLFASTKDLYDDADELASLTVAQLKDELKNCDLKVSGKKDELIQRLLDYSTEVENDDDEEEQQDEESGDSENVGEAIEEVLSGDDKAELLEEGGERPRSFSELNLMQALQSSIELQGWEDPTPIQQLAIPAILNHFSSTSNDDASSCSSLWAEAPTGSGKTGAFALPLIQLTLDDKKRGRNRRTNNVNDEEPHHRHQRHLGRANKSTRSITNNNNSSNGSGVTTLIVCPTRELAFQIGGVVEELIETMTSPSSSSKKRSYESLDVAVITGGTPLEPQIQYLASKKQNNENVDILIATPGRLADVLQRSSKEDTSEKELEKRLLAALDEVGGMGRGKKDVSLSLAQLEDLNINESIANRDDGGRSAIGDMLSNVKYLVLDEADRLLSHGFKAEMDELLGLLPKPPQMKKKKNSDTYSHQDRMKTLLFSATFPEQIEPRVEKVLKRLSGRDAPPPIRLSCAFAGFNDNEQYDQSSLSMRQMKRMERTTQPQAILEGPASTIELRTIRIEERDRTQALRRLINEYGTEQWDRVLVFVATRYASEHVARKLRRYNIKSSELHGKLDQDARMRRLDDFKKGKTRVLIATDVASRGLDVVGLPAVVNYDLPRSTADFTHRIGRTGRAGKQGTAVSFVTPTNEYHYNLIEKRHLNGSMVVAREVLKGFEPNEDKWERQSGRATAEVEGVEHSNAGLAHDRMHGGIKGRRKSKKDKLREKAAMKAANKK